MSFATFFSLVLSSTPFDEADYYDAVKRGQALRAQTGLGSVSLDDSVKKAIIATEMIDSIDQPSEVLGTLAKYLALNGELWAAGKIDALYASAKDRELRRRAARRKAAGSTNASRKDANAQWTAVAVRVGKQLRTTKRGAEMSYSELARAIRKSSEFKALPRRPSFHTVRAALPRLLAEKESSPDGLPSQERGALRRPHPKRSGRKS